MDFHPPHPTIARKLQLISQVLGTRPEPGRAKKLDRYAVDYQFDYSVIDELKDEIIKLPFDYPNDGQYHVLQEYLRQCRNLIDNPAIVSANTPADIYPNKECLHRSLIERIAGGLFPLVEDVFLGEREKCENMLLSETTLQYGFNLVLDDYPNFLDSFRDALKKNESENIESPKNVYEKLQRWIDGTQKPKSMKDLFDVLKKGSCTSNIKICEILFTAMVLDKTECLVADHYRMQDFFKKILANPKPDYNNTTDEYVQKIEAIQQVFFECQTILRKAAEKHLTDLSIPVTTFKKCCSKLQIDSIAAQWRTDLLTSLQKIYEGDYEGAKEIYECTIPYVMYTLDTERFCLYVTDDNWEKTVSFYHIALAIGAICEDRPFLKKMKNYGILFKLFGTPIEPPSSSYEEDAAPAANRKSRTKDTIVEDFEVEQWANSFFRIFPAELIPDIKSIDRFHTNADAPIHIIEGEVPKEPIKPYNKKDFKQGWKNFPQLVWFTYTGNKEAVKTLLDANVDVNRLTSSSESALLMAIEAMNPLNTPFQPEIGKEMFNLISQHMISQRPRDRKTINTKTINIPTNAQKLTCLGQSVWTGDLTVIETIIKMGAEIDAFQSTDRKTVLYRVVQYYEGLPQKTEEKVVYTLENIDGIRRGNECFRGMTNDQVLSAWKNRLQNPHMQMIFQAIREKINQRFDQVCPKARRLEIAEKLLRWKADPNKRHDINGIKGYTPLMLAAENDSLDMFELLRKYGGDPNLEATFPSGDRADCWKIAKSWNSKKILQFLYENREKYKIRVI